MGRMLSVAAREFVATVTTKGFIFGVLIFPLLMFAMMPLIIILMQKAAPTASGEVAVVDRSGQLTELQRRLDENSRAARIKEAGEIMEEELDLNVPGMDSAQIQRQMEASVPKDDLTIITLDTDADIEEEKKRLYETADGERILQAIVVVPDGAVFGSETDADPTADDFIPSYDSFELFVAPKLDFEIKGQIRNAINSAIVDARIEADQKATDANISPAYLQALLSRARSEVKTVTESGEKDSIGEAALMMPIAFMMLLWISVFTAGQYLLYSTIEEKSSRVMEVLLSAVSPMQLMAGKIIGQLGVGTIILMIYAGLGVSTLVVFAMMELIEWVDLVLLLVYFGIAFAMISCMMAAIGAAVNDVKEAGALMGPIMIVLIIPMILWMPISRAPNSMFSQVLSFLPPISPFIMVVRISGAEPIPLWQIPATIIVGLLAAYAFAWATAKIFRIGALMYGKPPNVGTLIKWIPHGVTEPNAGPPYDRHTLYECCVQQPSHAEALLRAIHGADPKILGEDFAGTGALSRLWVERAEDRSAIAVDVDADVLARCEGTPRIRTIHADVLDTDPSRDRADVIFVGNFSIGELHDRADLVGYLRHARKRLDRAGVFVCDTYGGETAFILGSTERDHRGPSGDAGERIRYTWEQREADPLTGRVLNALHFRVFVGDEVVQDMNDAFIYDWRLWSVPELRDAMREAGFGTTDVYTHLIDAVDDRGTPYANPVEHPDDIDDTFIVCVGGRP